MPQDLPPEDERAALRRANDARTQYLVSQGVPVPQDLLYVVSLLEFILGDRLDEAREFHEHRVAPILDTAVARLTQVQDARRSAEARRVLLDGAGPRKHP